MRRLHRLSPNHLFIYGLMVHFELKFTEYLSYCIPPGGSMIEGAGIFYPERMRHEKGMAEKYL